MAEATRITPEPVVQPPEKIVLEMTVEEANGVYRALVDGQRKDLSGPEFQVFKALRSVL